MLTPVAIVTGAGSGIGREVAVLLAEAGYRVALVGRRPEMLSATAEAVGAAPTLPIVADITDPDAAARIVDRTVEKWGRVDALVNNAGTVSIVPIGETTAEHLDRAFSVNAYAPALLIARVWPVFAGQGAGCVVNISSKATTSPFPGLSAYAASKSALESLTRSIANEGRDHGIRAFSIAPGAVETDMLRSLWSTDVIPPEQCLSPREVAQVAVDCIEGRRAADEGATIQMG